ncbi:MAG: transposase [Bacteroidota bacterium]
MHNQGRKSIRLKGYDYASDGAYFVTVVTKNRTHDFGKVIEGKVLLSEVGQIVEKEWLQSAELRAEVILDTCVIMPNHFHAVVWISHSGELMPPQHQSLPQTPDYVRIYQACSKDVSALMKGFKGAVKRKAKAAGYSGFEWQSRFHDRIIRNQDELDKVRLYIQNNPARWEEDELF